MHVRKMILALAIGCLSGTGAADADGSGPAAGSPQAAATQTGLAKAYRKSIFQSAVKRPGYRKRLVPINAGRREITVITLTRTDDVPDDFDNPFPHTKGRLTFSAKSGDTGVLGKNTWISLPKELATQCRTTADPLLALHMVLGMPPQTGKWELVRFRVAPRYIFRPCASGPSITSRRCSFEIPARPDGQFGMEETQSFVFRQMWSSYTDGFRWPGYPFTGMGWSYNWNPDAPTPYGISEYVVREGAPVSRLTTFTPAGFCQRS